MNKLAQILTLTVALGGASTSIASAITVSCPPSVSCTLRTIEGKVTLTSATAPSVSPGKIAPQTTTPANERPQPPPPVNFYDLLLQEIAKLTSSLPTISTAAR